MADGVLKETYSFCHPDLLCYPPGENKDSGRVCGLLLHVEKIGALRFLRPAKPVWEKEVHQLPRRNVSNHLADINLPYPRALLFLSKSLLKKHL